MNKHLIIFLAITIAVLIGSNYIANYEPRISEVENKEIPLEPIKKEIPKNNPSPAISQTREQRNDPYGEYNYWTCPYGENDIKTTSEYKYTNITLGFEVTLPAGWFVPWNESNNPHFYNCANGQAFEIQGGQLQFQSAIDAVYKEAYDNYQRNLITKEYKTYTDIIPGAIIIEYPKDDDSMWSGAYHIIFEKEKIAFTMLNRFNIQDSFIKSFRPAI